MHNVTSFNSMFPHLCVISLAAVLQGAENNTLSIMTCEGADTYLYPLKCNREKCNRCATHLLKLGYIYGEEEATHLCILLPSKIVI